MVKRSKEIMPSNNLVRVSFPLNDAEQGFETEMLWAEILGENRFRVANSPFFVFGVSAEDVVAATPTAHTLKFDRILEKSGHSTYRLFLQRGRTIDGDDFKEYWEPIARLGATFENGNNRVLAVDLSPAVLVSEVYKLLERGEADGIWIFEEGDYSEKAK
jgi:hypothetical protein